ncbi:bifunctional proline dehydrogenase/L-glutamate gamma-semialdehyde dehydrogenase PutA [Sneathiella marina]|uniref:Bifunctional protein PutA n=1 Tax=Sneathiella marina TaxID=2950108 RepID=A0ABY4W112_9PROT|nr:bifunctional proline dehydrogenase/L-glutamate gamma-semialdehyde dehydrogenase PutA [Sneathiella marina]USG60853.1 bifunctional proline dehydrogenase/L-glutamate gamma-semialdehyde dehydrogenase PutA [Sneathiella marina]
MAQSGTKSLRNKICRAYLADETDTVLKLAKGLGLDAAARAAIVEDAADLVEELRRANNPGVMETFLSEYGLTSEEGVALMCLAEALLRVPDDITIDALISDKIAPADWSKHLGNSASPLVNASTWGLMLTGKVIHPIANSDRDIGIQLRRVIKRVGEPVIRKAVSQSMKVLGHQFVLGRNIDEARARARGMEDKGYTYSYDMLGEAARTAADAQKYFMAYSTAISSLSAGCTSSDIRSNPGISVKLSALHPRYEYTQKNRVMSELVPRLSSLVFQAKNANMGFNIDAEEADRLDLSLDVIEAVLSNPDLAGWDGFGVVVQAYGPRASYVLDWLYKLAMDLDRRIMVRLVKGAYWDTEIKLAQVNGFERYPVFTRKASTDVSYLACAKKLLGMTDHIYPQFATHNAHSVSAILSMAAEEGSYEFQRLHGMGEGLHDLVMRQRKTRCRIYAPVGIHEDLLAYLVRRLLENGANSSFVNQVLDTDVPAREVVRDPVSAVFDYPYIPNSAIPVPASLYGDNRRNSLGINFADSSVLHDLETLKNTFENHQWEAYPSIDCEKLAGNTYDISNPALRSDIVGRCQGATVTQVEDAMACALSVEKNWSETPVQERANILEKIADLYEENRVELMALLAREAGKSVFDGISEVREAADFCRYYAMRARKQIDQGNHRGRGVFACISPWNFPLAIFTGQVVAALVAGNPVLAKPAEQTPLIAARAVQLMYEAGIPTQVLQFLPGDGATVGAQLVSHPDLKGTCFTGSTATAQIINRAMADNAAPESPLIAETGGLNAMIIDSSALPEQAVRDIIASAFQSAGQRCSALRVLYLQEDIADKLIEMLKGAMDELVIGNPWDIAVDVGPVIDTDAKAVIDAHCQKLEEEGRLIKKLEIPEDLTDGTFVGPAVYRIDGIDALKQEIFGPVLHVITFAADNVSKVVDQINATGYGLTLGIHTRVDTRVQEVCDAAHVGNLYVNRNQIGAVVGVQPFGGEGLSGTGPKAGGPHYLRRFMTGKPPIALSNPFNSSKAVSPNREYVWNMFEKSARAQLEWQNRLDRRQVLEEIALTPQSEIGQIMQKVLVTSKDYDPSPKNLTGPTGESNRLSLYGRGNILCCGDNALAHASVALLTGNAVILLEMSEEAVTYKEALLALEVPDNLVQILDADLTPELVECMSPLAGIALSENGSEIRDIRIALSRRPGALLPLIQDCDIWQDYVIERAICIDTTASGGNTALLAATEG